MNSYSNVREAWEIHDSIVVCNTLYASEANAGFFTSFINFGQQMEHLFFKRRSQGNVHSAYNNQLGEDRTDFVFRAFSVGLLFIAPPTHLDWSTDVIPISQDYAAPFWTQELPRHCSGSIKIGQDTNLKLNGMMMSPGYGPATNGAAYGRDEAGEADSFFPEFVYTSVQGLPIAYARYWIAGGTRENPEPIGIPKNEILEMKLKVSEHARGILATMGGPGLLRQGPSALPITFPSQFSIQASLHGYREVQQRGELRAT